MQFFVTIVTNVLEKIFHSKKTFHTYTYFGHVLTGIQCHLHNYSYGMYRTTCTKCHTENTVLP